MSAAYIQPLGRIAPDLFGADTASWVTAYQTEAEEKTSDLTGEVAAKAKRAWVYYRAFDAKANALAQSPMAASVGDSGVSQMQRSYVLGQVNDFRKLAAEALAEFNGYTEEVEPVANAVQTGILKGMRWA